MELSTKNWLRRLAIPFGGVGQKARSLGMSLIEIIIVIALIGIIMSIIITQLTTQQDEAMRDAAKLAMGKIQQSLQLYRVHNNRYPTTDQGLDALVRDPGNARKWRGPYIEEGKLQDPWGIKFEYESDGRNVKIVSAGPNGTVGDEDDIVYPEESRDQN